MREVRTRNCLDMEMVVSNLLVVKDDGETRLEKERTAMKVYLIGWEGDIHVFAWKEQAVDWHCLECDACKTWEDVVDDAKEINAEGNYHKYFAEEKEVE